MRKFYIAWFDGVDSGVVDYEDQPSFNIDNALFFTTESEAEEYKNKIQNDWKSELKVCDLEEGE